MIARIRPLAFCLLLMLELHDTAEAPGVTSVLGAAAPQPGSMSLPPVHAQGAPEPRKPEALPTRSVAVTFDDLPATRFATLAEAQAITADLLRHIEAYRIPAIGFVNEAKLFVESAEQPARVALLEAWLDAGLDLGNHTYSHLRLYDTALPDYQADVLRGERVTRRLLAASGRRPRFFRHPTLSTGPDRKTKAAFERFLAKHDYAVAPVTIDSDEYLYALAYDRARTAGDAATARRLSDDYVRYMAEMFGFFEGLSRRLLGREPAQVLMLHANALNAHCLGRLAAMMAERGYRFLSLEEALEDAAYDLPDDYIGPRGPSWLERWAITRGLEPGERPPVPTWVLDVAGHRRGGP